MLTKVVIDNNIYHIESKNSLTILQLCDRLNIEIPRFCYYDKLSVSGNCRICTVEIKNGIKPVTSCTTNVMNDMVIFTKTPLVKKAREAVMEFLLINHPLDCPICDQGGECDLQDLSLNYGSDRSRYYKVKRVVEDKNCGPIVKTVMTRCIHCTRCVRFLTEICGVNDFGVVGRGSNAEISTFLEKNFKIELSGNLIDLCPVGALTSKPEAFIHRSWELHKKESLDFYDAFGSNIYVYTRNAQHFKNYNVSNELIGDSIIRILPKTNLNINDDWISDKTRYAYDYIFKNRNFFILNNFNNKINWYNLLEYLIEKKPLCVLNWKNKKLISAKTLTVYGNFLDVQSLYYSNNFFKKIGQNNFLLENITFNINKDIPFLYRFNKSVKNLKNVDFCLIINLNPRFESSLLNIHLRKNYMLNKTKIYVLGNHFNSLYPIIHLGNSLQLLLDIVEGRHFICKEMRRALNPIILIGSEFLEKNNSNQIFDIIQYLVKKSFLNIYNVDNYNLIVDNTTKQIINELGIYNSTFNKLYDIKWLSSHNFKKNYRFLFNINNDINQNNNVSNNTQCNIHLHSHYVNNFDLLIPIKSLYEKQGFLINIEGRVQKFKKVISSYGFSSNCEDFFKILTLFYNNNKDLTTFSKNNLSVFKFYYPKLILKQKYYNFNSHDFQYKYNNILFLNKLKNNYISLNNFRKLIKNFYMTDFLSKNSKIMAESYKFIKNEINFKSKC